MPGYIKPPSNQYIYSSSTVDGARIMTAASDYGFRNKLINGDFSIWQRGTSFNIPSNSNTFCADRWQIQSQGGTAVASQQTFSPGTLNGIETPYYLRLVQSVGSANTLVINRLEDARTLAGQSITISYWAKASASTTITARFDQDFGSGGSSRAANGGLSNTITTSWNRYSSTFTVSSVSGKTFGTGSYVEFFLYYPNTAGITVELAGIQIESGLSTTPFEYRPQQIELAMCQRYFQRISNAGSSAAYVTIAETFCSTGGWYGVRQLIVPMRVAPISISYSGISMYEVGTNTYKTYGTPVIDYGTTTPYAIGISAGGGTMTANTYYRLQANNNGAAYFDINAEL